MKTQSILILLTIFFAIFYSSVFAGTYSGGTGETNDPYQIATAEDLNDIGNHIEDFNKCFVMVADINLAAYRGTQFNIIGIYDINPFTGTFDGNGNIIFNFTYTDLNSTVWGTGLFSYIGGTGQVKNLSLVDANVTGGQTNPFGYYVGGLAGVNDGTITACYINGTVSGNYFVGGLVGDNHGNIIHSYAICDVIGSYTVGGLTGMNGGSGRSPGTIIDCYTIGSISGSGRVGGLTGGNVCQSIIKNCYSIANVLGSENRVGGLVGENADAYILNSYSTGSVVGSGDYGGLVGWIVTGICPGGWSCNECFWDIETSEQTTSACGQGKTTAEMKQIGTFTNWDFVETWGIEDNQTYPFLKLTYPVGDLNYDKVVNLLDFAVLASHWLEDNSP